MNVFRRWLVRRLEESDRIASEETPYKQSLKLELPPLDETWEKPRYGFWSAMMFLALLSSPAWGAALGYFVFANFYDGGRAKALGVAAGMTFTPALMFAAIILFGLYIIWSHDE